MTTDDMTPAERLAANRARAAEHTGWEPSIEAPQRRIIADLTKLDRADEERMDDE